MRLLAMTAAAAAMLAAVPAAAQEGALSALEPYIGQWVTPDGTAARLLSWGNDKSVVNMEIRAAGEDGTLVIVSQGSYRAPANVDEITGFATALGLDFSHYRVTGEPEADGIAWTNEAAMRSGETVVSREEWTGLGEDGSWSNTVFGADGEVWWEAQWVRPETLEADTPEG